jgi:hypothetical protein
MQVGHLTGEELDVGAADTHSFDVDDDLAARGHRLLDVLDLALQRAGDDERPHACTVGATAQLPRVGCLSSEQ